MTILKKILPSILILAFISTAQAEDGFSVGGVGDFGGTATGSIGQNGWQNVEQYRSFLDYGYTNSAADAQLANIAQAADDGTNGQTETANCPQGDYPTLRTSCGSACSTLQRDDMQDRNLFNNVNFCFSPRYSNYSSYVTASGLDYGLTPIDAGLYTAATGASDELNAVCPNGNCATASKADFQIAQSAYLAGFTTFASANTANDQGYDFTVADFTLFTEAQTDTYNAFCPNTDCSTADKIDFQSAKLVQASVSDGNPLDGNTIENVLENTDSDIDADVSLDNPLHLAYVQNCIGTNTALSSIENCASNVDGLSLNKFVVSEIADGASGTITSNLLQDAGISSTVADLATSNSCGANENQPCLTNINTLLAAGSDFSTGQIEAILADHIDDLVEASDTQVSVAATSAGCSTSPTTFAVPNPPAICASVNWDCSANTPGVSVTYDDNGKGNIVVDTTSFSGGAYTVTASLTVGSQTRTRTINGTVNVNQLSAAAGAGYKTGWQPAWWRNYNVIERARNACSAQGGSLTTYEELKAANATYGIISNGTRTIFADASGNASASTSGRQQCSESWPSGPNSLRWYTWARSQTCKGRAGFGRNFTYVCKDIPCN